MTKDLENKTIKKVCRTNDCMCLHFTDETFAIFQARIIYEYAILEQVDISDICGDQQLLELGIISQEEVDIRYAAMLKRDTEAREAKDRENYLKLKAKFGE